MTGRNSGRLLALAVLLLAACSQQVPATVLSPEEQRPAVGVAPAPAVAEPAPVGDAGVSLLSLLDRPISVFGPAVTVPVQVESERLLDLLEPHPRLHMQALPSPAGTAAINFVEDSGPGDRWGDAMIPVQRTLFAAFAGDASFGEWLVVVSDIEVLEGPDPIPVTAYRWSRAAVEAYADCGIPSHEIDECTSVFYGASETVLVRGSGDRGVAGTDPGEESRREASRSA